MLRAQRGGVRAAKQLTGAQSFVPGGLVELAQVLGLQDRHDQVLVLVQELRAPFRGLA